MKLVSFNLKLFSDNNYLNKNYFVDITLVCIVRATDRVHTGADVINKFWSSIAMLHLNKAL